MSNIDELTADGDVYPEGTNKVYEIGGRYKADNFSANAGYSVSKSHYNDGDPDTNSIDTSNYTGLYLSAAITF